MRVSPRIIAGVAALSLVGAVVSAAPSIALAPPGESLRPTYHLTAPHDWLSDPQRPIWANNAYQLYYLYGDRQSEGGGWRHATTTDGVVFTDRGMAIDKQPNFPVWTGSLVVDDANTAGFGAGAVVALATQPTGGDRFDQEQYLYYSTDGGTTFTAYGSPVIVNPGNNDWFRDPKISWDAANSNWVAVIGMAQKARFFTSTNLKTWTYKSEFSYTSPNIGGMECPDIFRIKASDGTWHWVFGASMQGDYSGLPNTFAYWTGSWNGTSFVPDSPTPQWLDYGLDWYAQVSWPDHSSPDDTRYSIAWMNNWRYADENLAIPSSVSDDISGQMSITRKLQLSARGGGVYTILSTPVPALGNHVAAQFSIPNTTLASTYQDLDYHGTAYELETDISWTSVQNVGISVGRSADNSRYTNLGIYQNQEFYTDRSHSEITGQTPDVSFGGWTHTDSSFSTSALTAHLRVFVDKGSVEVFVDDGAAVHSGQVYFGPGEDGIRLYTDGGTATFSNTVIREYEDITTAADPASAYATFEGANYGSWTTTGTAFGSGPAAGTLPSQQPVTGYVGSKLVNSYLSGDSTTGVLSSPNFTVSNAYVNFLVGGGYHPAPGKVFADFEGAGFGTGWTASGSYSGQAPSSAALTNKVGSKAVDTYVGGGDPATGTISSPTFTVTGNRIDFRIGGGNHPWGATAATAVNLVIGGVVYRTATGDDSGTLRDISWDVHDLVGRTAQLQIVDNATGAWGHLMVDQIVFADQAGSIGGEADTQTTVNLVVGGQVVRSTTGRDEEKLRWTSWLVNDLVGQTAHIEIVDRNTGSWGHITADQITFDDRPAD